ncbi:hypothetical protein GQR58_006688 [Nymphon striatum]|nr:hypothetical protein GQR58_006688 [Nymphon striatum]
MSNTTSNQTNRKQLCLIIATSCACLFTSTASADWGLSLNVDNEIGRYAQKDTDGIASIGIQYRGENFNMDSEALSYSLMNTEKYAFEVIAKSHHAEIDPKDIKFFKGMDKRKTSLDLGCACINENQASEATASRAAYTADAATTPYIGHISFDAGVVYERRDDSMKNSPLTNDKDHDIVANLVLSAVRSAVGGFGGSLSQMEPHELAGQVMKEAVSRSTVDPANINYVTCGKLYSY